MYGLKSIHYPFYGVRTPTVASAGGLTFFLNTDFFFFRSIEVAALF